MTSTKTGFTPNSHIPPTVATKVLAAVITSSPCLTPTALSEILIASVPELTPTAYFVHINYANLFSKIVNSLPKVKSPF